MGTEFILKIQLQGDKIKQAFCALKLNEDVNVACDGLFTASEGTKKAARLTLCFLRIPIAFFFIAPKSVCILVSL